MSLDWFNGFYQQIASSRHSHWLETLPAQLAEWHRNSLHGEYAKWLKLLSKLPQPQVSQFDLTNRVQIGASSDVDEHTLKHIEGLLRQFAPWRKGPFDLFGLHIDTEWRSDWKWERLLPHIHPLKGRDVLDIGCGSGYHMWRMLGEQANLVVGADPSQLFLIQFQAIKHFLPKPNIHLLPIGVEQLPKLKSFDTVFSMGVLYHRKSPIDFLQQLKDQLRPGGELVLETLVVDGDEHTVFMPTDRYAQMRNVWYLPSCDALRLWMKRVGFEDIQVVDVSTTSVEEQRRTSWMDGHSLQDFLDPQDPSKTIEGYPAPTRAVIIAKVR